MGLVLVVSVALLVESLVVVLEPGGLVLLPFVMPPNKSLILSFP